MFLPKADRIAASLFPARSSHTSVLRRTLFFLCWFASASSFAQTAQPDDQPKKISGTVINAVTKAPIPRALVFSSDDHFAALTDAEGQFEFKGEIERGYEHFSGNCSWLRARKPGFLDDCANSGEEPGASDDPYSIALTPESLIYGRVNLPESDTLSGTPVELYYREVMDGLPRWIPRGNVSTNSAGEFRFSELHAGEYRLLMHERGFREPVTNNDAQSFGYPPVYYPSATDFAGAPSIRVSAGQAVEADISATRQPYYRVTIPVASEISSGLAITVRAQSGPGYSLGYNVPAKRIEGFLPTGIYVVDATVYGPNSASGSVNLKVNAAPAEGPTLTLVPASSVTLDVKQEFTDTSWKGSSFWSDGKRSFTMQGPRGYLNPRLESVDEMQPMRGGSLRPPNGPNDNSIVLEDVQPGSYWLRLNTARGYVASARVGDVDLLHQPLAIGAGLSMPIEIELRDDTAEIDGTVTGLSASANAESRSSSVQAWIYCVPLPDSAGQFQQLIASEDARFNQSMMAPGDYRLLAFAHAKNRLPYRDAEAMKAYETKGPVVHLAAGQKTNVQVPLITESSEE